LLSVTPGLFTITCDNASPNNTMLLEVEKEYYAQRCNLTALVYQPWNFTQKDGDVQCIAHVFNIAVQAVLVQLKAIPSNQVEDYRVEPNAARLLYHYSQDEIVSALSKLRI
jgi:hypothetical protein